MLSTWIITVDVNFDHLAEVVFVRESYSCPPFYTAFFGEKWLLQPTFKGWRLALPFLVGDNLELFLQRFLHIPNNLEFILHSKWVSHFYLFNQSLIISVWTYEYLSYCSNCFNSDYWELTMETLVPTFLWHAPTIVGFFKHFLYFLTLQYDPCSSCTFLAPVLELAVSPRTCFCLLKNGIKNQDLGARYAHC